MRATLVLPTFNRCADLERAITSLAGQTESVSEVIVVDNGSTDRTREMVEALAQSGKLPFTLRYHRKDPEGPAAARTCGIALSTTPVVGFVDSDVTLAPDWLGLCLAALDADPALGAVAGPLVYAGDPGQMNSYGGCLSRLGLAWDGFEGAPLQSAAATRDVPWINSAALLARRAALDDAGGFDPRFFYAYEESDLGWRMCIAGWRLRVIPDALAFHHVGDEIGQAAPGIVFHSCKNRLASLLANAGPGWLARWLPAYLAYALLDAGLRAPRGPKLRALAWSLANLRGTLARRQQIQSRRRVPDEVLSQLLEPRLFPEVRLAGRRRRPNRLQSINAPAGWTDDRV